MMPRRETFKRVLPDVGQVMVEKGQLVFPYTIIAETKLQPVEPVIIPVTEQLGLPPHMMNQMAIVKVGDLVETGQVLAGVVIEGLEYEVHSPAKGKIEDISPLLGTIALRLEGDPDEPVRVVNVAAELEMPELMAKRFIEVRQGAMVKMGDTLAKDDEEKKVFAPIAGLITEIKGATISIKRPFVLRQVFAYVSGFVTEIVPDLGAMIESDVLRVPGVYGVGGETWGVLRVAVANETETLKAEGILESDKDKILLAGAMVEGEALQKAQKLGVKAIISGGMHNKDVTQLCGHEIKPGVLDSALCMTLIVTEGMGVIPMNVQAFQAIAQKEGKMISVNGLTQIRAGVIRPEVLLPVEDDEGISTTEEATVGSLEDFVVGNQVRIIREPWFGEVGSIESIPLGETVLPSGVKTLVYEIKTASGTVLVPRANVEPYRS